jgi:probable FeS assembly SUF system protein SufT
MYRLEDADVPGLAATQTKIEVPRGALTEQAVWDELRTVFDPEIPVNIADLGLIYSCAIKPLQDGANKIEIKMTLTAPGCGMADVLKADVERKLLRLTDVKEVSVEVVFEPPWSPSRMTEASKLQLGLDLDFSPSTSALPILNSGRR